jgi:hypothetical protein
MFVVRHVVTPFVEGIAAAMYPSAKKLRVENKKARRTRSRRMGSLSASQMMRFLAAKESDQVEHFHPRRGSYFTQSPGRRLPLYFT